MIDSRDSRECGHRNQRLDVEAGEMLCLKCGAVRGMGEDVWEQEGEGHV